MTSKTSILYHFRPDVIMAFYGKRTFLGLPSCIKTFILKKRVTICQRVVLLNLLDTKVNPNCLLFHRERERENRRSPVLRGWSGGAMVLEKYSEPKRPTNLDNSRARVYCTCSRCGLFGHFSPRLSFLFSFSLFGRRTGVD